MNKITSSLSFEYEYSTIKNSELIAYKIIILDDPWEIFAEVRRSSYFYDDNNDDRYHYTLPLTLQGLSTKEDFLFFTQNLSLNNYYEKLKKFDLHQYFLCSKQNLYNLQTQKTYWNVFLEEQCLSTNTNFDALFNNEFEELLLIIDSKQPIIFSTEQNHFPKCLYLLTSIDIPTSEHDVWFSKTEPSLLIIQNNPLLNPEQEFLNNLIDSIVNFDLFKPNPPYSVNLVHSNREDIIDSFNNGNEIIPLHFKIKDIDLYDLSWKFYVFSLELMFEEDYGYNPIATSSGYYPVEKHYNYYYGNAIASLFLFKLLELDKNLLINMHTLSEIIGFSKKDIHVIEQFILKTSLDKNLSIKDNVNNSITKNKL